MAYSENIADKIRQALSHLQNVEEKKMFGGIAFMVDGKMCMTAGKDRMMCRIDPAIQEEVLKRNDSRIVIMKGKEYKGYVYVNEDRLEANDDFEFWTNLALDFNKRVKAIKKK